MRTYTQKNESLPTPNTCDTIQANEYTDSCMICSFTLSRILYVICNIALLLYTVWMHLNAHLHTYLLYKQIDDCITIHNKLQTHSCFSVFAYLNYQAIYPSLFLFTNLLCISYTAEFHIQHHCFVSGNQRSRLCLHKLYDLD